MRLDEDGDFKKSEAHGPAPRQPWARLAIVLSLTVLYALAFWAFSNTVGRVASALIAIPVAAAGWYFGIQAGLVAGLLGVAMIALLQMMFTGSAWSSAILNYWPGDLMVIVFGYLSGRLHMQFAEDARVRDKLRSRERFLVLIGMVTSSILDPKSNGNAYRALIGHLGKVFGADYAYLTRWDATRKQAAVIAETTPTHSEFRADRVLTPDETTLITAVLQSKRVMAIDNVPKSHYVVRRSVSGEPVASTQSALGVPLIMGEYEFGVAMLAFKTPRRFTPEELEFAKLASNQFALALWTTEQQLVIQKRLREANALANIERVLERVRAGGN